MLVTSIIDADELVRRSNSIKHTKEFIESTIPLWAKSVKFLVDNQYYYAATLIRESLDIPKYIGDDLIAELVKDRSVTGIIGTVIPFERALALCNFDLLYSLMAERT